MLLGLIISWFSQHFKSSFTKQLELPNIDQIWLIVFELHRNKSQIIHLYLLDFSFENIITWKPFVLFKPQKKKINRNAFKLHDVIFLPLVISFWGFFFLLLLWQLVSYSSRTHSLLWGQWLLSARGQNSLSRGFRRWGSSPGSGSDLSRIGSMHRVTTSCNRVQHLLTACDFCCQIKSNHHQIEHYCFDKTKKGAARNLFSFRLWRCCLSAPFYILLVFTIFTCQSFCAAFFLFPSLFFFALQTFYVSFSMLRPHFKVYGWLILIMCLN